MQKDTKHIPIPRWVFILAYLAVPVKFLFSLSVFVPTNCQKLLTKMTSIIEKYKTVKSIKRLHKTLSTTFFSTPRQMQCPKRKANRTTTSCLVLEQCNQQTNMVKMILNGIHNLVSYVFITVANTILGW